MALGSLLQRALSSNLIAAKVTDKERSQLLAAGIVEPTIQKYLVWRRSVCFVVAIATLAGAALATSNNLGLLDNFSGRLWTIAEDLTGADEAPEKDGAAHQKEEPQTRFARFADNVHFICLNSLPVVSLAAALSWTHRRKSQRFLLAGWVLGFFVPMLIALAPWSWWGYSDISDKARNAQVQRLERIAEGVKEGAEYLVMLLPTVLSLIPGVQRACLRIKTLLPESMLPGWFLVSAAPFNSLLLLVIFIAINQVASNPLLLIGMLLLLAAPLAYVVRSDILTRPLMDAADHRRLKLLKLTVSGITIAAAAILAAYLSTQTIAGLRVIGFDSKASLLHPMDLLEYGVEFLGRSMFVTVLAADIFLGMNLTTWRYSKAFAGSPAERNYDAVMTQLQNLP